MHAAIMRKSLEQSQAILARDTSVFRVFNLAMTRKLIAEWLDSGLKQRSMKQADLARAVRMEPSKISKIIRLEREMNAEELLRIAYVLDLEPPLLPDLGKSVRMPRPDAEEDPEDERLFDLAIQMAADEEAVAANGLARNGEFLHDVYHHYIRLKKLNRRAMSRRPVTSN
jgi:transcriptional regulator with XRE-family HTH domain